MTTSTSDLRGAGVPGDRGHAQHDSHNGHQSPDFATWEQRSRIVLTPIAAPSIMGLSGFFIATLMVGAWQAGWYGDARTPLVLWPLAMFAGGVLQTISAVASFRARDGIAVAVHTVWGAFWSAWGVMELLVATGVMAATPIGAVNQGFAFWFIGLCMVTFSAMLAALARNELLALVLAALAGGSGITAAGYMAGSSLTVNVGGWFFVVSAALAWLAMTAMVLEHAFGRTIIPIGAPKKSALVPGRTWTQPIEYPYGMPGARVGQ